MKSYNRSSLRTIFLVLTCFFFLNQNTSQAQSPWSKSLPGLGTFSSPRTADLNGDGVQDIILGAGREEFLHCDSAVVAIDGSDGTLLWTGSADDQVFASAAIKDLNGDGTEDVLIGGRTAELKALNGKNGEELWSFRTIVAKRKKQKRKYFNFYNPQWIPDQDGDGLEDILISNGGDVLAKPYDPKRPTGYLMVISSQNGQILAEAAMPDGRETYMSVAVMATKDGKQKIIFGSGGETIGGALYVATLQEVLQGDLSKATKLASSKDKGFIGPPVWVDINQDGTADIVANAVDGRLLAFDGITYQAIWEAKMPNTEAYSSIAIGYFNSDATPDFFVSYAEGVWPDLKWCKQFMVDGASGQIQFEENLGFYQTSTPVVLDVNQDGIDEALLLVTYQVQEEDLSASFYTMPMLIDFKTGKALELGLNVPGGNIASTPWIGDLENDGYLDILFCHGTDKRYYHAFNGLTVERLTTKISAQGVRWGAYMGSNYDGVFRNYKSSFKKPASIIGPSVGGNQDEK